MTPFSAIFNSSQRMFECSDESSSLSVKDGLSHSLKNLQKSTKVVVTDDIVLPTYRSKDVRKHMKPVDRVWVSHKDGVYDITEFLKVHPGGAEKVMMAAGGPLEPFW